MRGPETEKSHNRRVRTGFYSKYMNGNGLDIGYRGDVINAEPVLDSAIGIEFDYPGYDGEHLPFENESQDYVYNSHCLEHILQTWIPIKEWFRVLKVGGFLIIVVPHQFLYEKKKNLPSLYNGDHKHFFTPAYLLEKIEEALEPNSYRIRYLQDCDEDFDYSRPPLVHSGGEYQIELVIEKIVKPNWELI